jgi:hypothetical protein
MRQLVLLLVNARSRVGGYLFSIASSITPLIGFQAKADQTPQMIWTHGHPL